MAKSYVITAKFSNPSHTLLAPLGVIFFEVFSFPLSTLLHKLDIHNRIAVQKFNNVVNKSNQFILKIKFHGMCNIFSHGKIRL